MKTLAVMCIALTRTSPSRTPLSLTPSSICGVMLRNAIRAGMLKVRYSVCDFMTVPGKVGRRPDSMPLVGRSGVEVGAEVFQSAVAHEEGDGGPRLGPVEELPGRGEVGAGGEPGEDALLGRQQPGGSDRVGVAHLNVAGHERSVEQRQVGPGVAGPLELVPGV